MPVQLIPSLQCTSVEAGLCIMHTTVDRLWWWQLCSQSHQLLLWPHVHHNSWLEYWCELRRRKRIGWWRGSKGDDGGSEKKEKGRRIEEEEEKGWGMVNGKEQEVGVCITCSSKWVWGTLLSFMDMNEYMLYTCDVECCESNVHRETMVYCIGYLYASMH